MLKNRGAILGMLFAILAFLAGGVYFDQMTVEAQSSRGVFKQFTAQAATGQTASFNAMGSANSAASGAPINHVAELIVTGGPSGCTYRLQGSADNSSWYNLSAADITCTSTTVGNVSNFPAKYVRGNLLTLTGGTSPTVTLKYLGK